MGLFGGPSKQQLQQARIKLQMERAQRLADAKSLAQQIIDLQKRMAADGNCQDLMEHIEKAIEANKAGLTSITSNPKPIKTANIGIFLHIDDPNAQPWDLNRKKTVRINYMEYDLSLTGLNEMAFMYWILLRNPVLAYKDNRGPNRDVEDVLTHCYNVAFASNYLTTLYNTKRR